MGVPYGHYCCLVIRVSLAVMEIMDNIDQEHRLTEIHTIEGGQKESHRWDHIYIADV